MEGKLFWLAKKTSAVERYEEEKLAITARINRKQTRRNVSSQTFGVEAPESLLERSRRADEQLKNIEKMVSSATAA